MLDDFSTPPQDTSSQHTPSAHHPHTGPSDGVNLVDRVNVADMADRDLVDDDPDSNPDQLEQLHPRPVTVSRWLHPTNPANRTTNSVMTPPLLTAVDHRRAPAASDSPPVGETPSENTSDVASGRQSRANGRSRFGIGVVVGAAATGIFALGGIAGATLIRGDDTPTAVVAARPVAFESSASNPGSVHELVTAVRPSIVAIHTEITATNQFGQIASGSGAGTGWVLSADGYIVTNSHVVADATSIEVAFDDGSTEAAELVGADSRSDLAVLHVDRTDLTPLPLGDSDATQVGDGVVAIGNALDLGAEPTVTRGIVSAKDRSITEETGAPLVNLIQTDAAISRGNSGGPLLDLTGRVVGINTAVSGLGQNIGFAISINSAMDYITELQVGQAPSHPLLGVNSAPTADGSGGAMITDVTAGTAAAEAGLQNGDIVTAIDDEPITGPDDLAASIARKKVGDSISITIVRNGTESTLVATVGARETAAS